MADTPTTVETEIGIPVRCEDMHKRRAGMETTDYLLPHRSVEFFTIVDVYEVPATVPRGQRPQIPHWFISCRVIREHEAEPGFDQSRHRSTSPFCLLSETLHYGIFDHDRHRHIDDHIMGTSEWEAGLITNNMPRQSARPDSGELH